MRYERRDPRAEDLREIEELKGRIESQDRDLCRLTEKLRELQNQQQQQLNGQQSPHIVQAPQRNNISNKTNGSNNKSPAPPKQQKSKINCNVIYEENEERDEESMAASAAETFV